MVSRFVVSKVWNPSDKPTNVFRKTFEAQKLFEKNIPVETQSTVHPFLNWVALLVGLKSSGGLPGDEDVALIRRIL